MFISNIHVSLCSINLCLENGPGKKVYLKTYLSNTPNTMDQIQIQIHGLKFDRIQIHHICICICICKYQYVFDPSPARKSRMATQCPSGHLLMAQLALMSQDVIQAISLAYTLNPAWHDAVPDCHAANVINSL